MRRSPLVRAAAFAALASLGSAAQDARTWLEFPSRESTKGKPARLVLVAGGKTHEIRATADAPLLSYLPAASFGALTELPIGLADQNRSLVRFDLGGHAAGSLERCDLVLDLAPGKPGRPGPGFTIAVHRVEQAWNEFEVSWQNQPPFAAEPEAVIRGARGGTVTVDVSGVVRRWLESGSGNHGLLLKLHGATDPAAVSRRLAATLPWTDDAAAALARAASEGRLVLTLLRGAYDANAEDWYELVLRATVFADPSVVSLVERRFVPLRARYVPIVYTQQQEAPDDPLKPLGAKSTGIKAPALLVSTPAGKLVASLESIGTFDAELVHAFLRAALAKDGAPATRPSRDFEEMLAAGEIQAASSAAESLPPAFRPHARARVAAASGDHEKARKIAEAAAASAGEGAADLRVQAGVSAMRLGDLPAARDLFARATTGGAATPRSAEALFWLGCVSRALGDADGRTRAWERLRKEHAATLWALRADAHLSWPDRLDPLLSLRKVDLARPAAGTEQGAATAGAAGAAAAAAARAVAWLLEQQQPDGAWPSEDEPARGAITAVCTKALFSWQNDVPPASRARTREAVSRGLAWLREYLAREDPAQANSFGAAYVLDAALACTAPLPKDERKAFVGAAIAFLAGGQCDNGAWSYSLEFHRNWRGGFGGWPTTDKGRVHSVNTGPAIVFLQTAKRQGFSVSDEVLRRGVKVLQDMRVGPGVYTYTYPVPRVFEKPDQSIGRGPVCELALFLSGAATREDLATALEAFRKHRSHLRTNVKLDHSWSSPIASSSYFFFYAYYNAHLALKAAGGSLASELAAELRSDLLGFAEVDGTWMDFENNGKPYGTAMALLVLR